MIKIMAYSTWDSNEKFNLAQKQNWRIGEPGHVPTPAA